MVGCVHKQYILFKDSFAPNCDMLLETAMNSPQPPQVLSWSMRQRRRGSPVPGSSPSESGRLPPSSTAASDHLHHVCVPLSEVQLSRSSCCGCYYSLVPRRARL